MWDPACMEDPLVIESHRLMYHLMNDEPAYAEEGSLL